MHERPSKLGELLSRDQATFLALPVFEESETLSKDKIREALDDVGGLKTREDGLDLIKLQREWSPLIRMNGKKSVKDGLNQIAQQLIYIRQGLKTRLKPKAAGTR